MQPSSVDLHVDRYFRVFRNDTTPYIDPKQHQEDLTELVEVGDDGAFILHPGEFVLGSTLERVALPDDLVARLEGKTSLGRLGLLIHSTAGFVDAGWDGHLTLELSNVANLPIALYPGMKIGQISFLRMTTAAEHPYGSEATGSKYQGQRGPTPSRYYLNFAPPTTGSSRRAMPEPHGATWAGTEPLMVAYHDDEWGVPTHDDAALFELLTLEGAQAGLSWRTILNKREGYRTRVRRLRPSNGSPRSPTPTSSGSLGDAGIVRHRGKIESTINNAQRVLEVQRELGSFDAYVWSFVDGTPIVGTWHAARRSCRRRPPSRPR